MIKNQKRYNPEEKVTIIRRHLLEKEPISNVCYEYNTLRLTTDGKRNFLNIEPKRSGRIRTRRKSI